MTQATVAAHRIHDTAVRIAISGEIDLANADVVQRRILGVITNQLTEVSVDLSGVTYIDSAGLRVLLRLGTRLETLQIALELLVPPDSPTRRVIELSGMGEVASVRPTPD
ncbi:STAS domain-containing protein [Pseudonocardia bannensis]|uniref:Anti-sigma factor antagonist n=1 Tax=Pseudonocardia bannensis TaxID=630973 RepID=A0A848DDV9_9PSEU|nr:STAS domain-containing protein [Pseudonocardia bannensis]NMH90771.1 STAS domain-containing protein [Pseudonocardia bannensis]